MQKKLSGLVVLNAVLLLVLGVFCLTPQSAEAQLGGRGGDYLMIAGQTQGQTTSTVYIIDLESAKMIAVAYDTSAKALQVLAGRDVASDVKEGK